jgi:hypothetical protein
MQISPGWLKQKILKIKNASQKILTNFFVSEVFFKKCQFQYAFDDKCNSGFLKQIFRAVQLAPPFPLPLTGLCRGWGSSISFQPQAVAFGA